MSVHSPVTPMSIHVLYKGKVRYNYGTVNCKMGNLSKVTDLYFHIYETLTSLIWVLINMYGMLISSHSRAGDFSKLVELVRVQRSDFIFPAEPRRPSALASAVRKLRTYTVVRGVAGCAEKTKRQRVHSRCSSTAGR